MLRRLRKFYLMISLALISLIPAGVLATELPDVRKTADEAAQGLPGVEGDTTLADFIGGIISGLLGLLGIVFFILTIYGGALWMTASGNEEQVNKAKKILTSSVIGLVIIMMAYAITTFVVDYLQRSAF